MAANPAGIIAGLQPYQTLTDGPAYAYFQKRVLALANVDLTAYKSEQMLRRLGPLLSRSGARDLVEYGRILGTNPTELQRFRDSFTINVSEFFRDPERFVDLQNKVLPRLVNPNRTLKIWSAGCSVGCEPYTISMILAEAFPRQPFALQATDVDATTLERAKQGGPFSASDVKNVAPLVLQRHFELRKDTYWVKDPVRSRPRFRVQDLLRDKYETDYDLVVCRNVVIYFTESAKDRVCRGLAKSLRVGGVLLLGGTESLSNPPDLGLVRRELGYYERVT